MNLHQSWPSRVLWHYFVFKIFSSLSSTTSTENLGSTTVISLFSSYTRPEKHRSSSFLGSSSIAVTRRCPFLPLGPGQSFFAISFVIFGRFNKCSNFALFSLFLITAARVLAQIILTTNYWTVITKIKINLNSLTVLIGYLERKTIINMHVVFHVFALANCEKLIFLQFLFYDLCFFFLLAVEYRNGVCTVRITIILLSQSKQKRNSKFIKND